MPKLRDAVGRHFPFKLGKLPARPGAVTFKFAAFAVKEQLPTPPKVFGHQGVIGDWLMLGNDRWGCCVFSGGAHETMMWSKIGEAPDASFNDACIAKDYGAVTGFKVNDPNTDQGTDMSAAASYRRKTGLVDTNRKRHKILAYMALKKRDTDQLAVAAYMYGAVGIGVQFPDSAMSQFEARKPWKPVTGSRIGGGHYIPVVGRVKNGNFLVVTWGRLHEMTPAFYKKYCDEALVYLSSEMLVGGKSVEGIDLAKLKSSLSGLG
jgi:hypothetical protein